MLRSILKIILIFLIFYTPVFSKNYNKILINGNNRISNDTILVFADIPPKEFLDEISLNTILKNIYNSNFFKHQRLDFSFEDKFTDYENWKWIVEQYDAYLKETNHVEIVPKIIHQIWIGSRVPKNMINGGKVG